MPQADLHILWVIPAPTAGVGSSVYGGVTLLAFRDRPLPWTGYFHPP